jgi:hypothetical protein
MPKICLNPAFLPIDAIKVYGTPKQLKELSEAIDEYNSMIPANPLGDRLTAEIILRDHSHKIVVPSMNEWYGINWLEYDSKLKRNYQ